LPSSLLPPLLQRRLLQTIPEGSQRQHHLPVHISEDRGKGRRVTVPNRTGPRTTFGSSTGGRRTMADREPRSSAADTLHRGVRGGTQVPNRQSSFDHPMAEYTAPHIPSRPSRRASTRRRHISSTTTHPTLAPIQHSAEHVLRECPLVPDRRSPILGTTSIRNLFHTTEGAGKLAEFLLTSNSLLRPLPELPDPP